MRRVLVLGGLLSVVVVAIAIAGGFSTTSHPAGRHSPPLPHSVLVGPPVTLANLRGRPAVINFWASWCAPCKREAPAFAAFARSLHGRAQLVGINWNDTAAGARAFVRRYHWTFPNLRDGDGSAGNAYGLIGLPTTFILDSRGRIAQQLTGQQSIPRLSQALKRLGV